MADNVAKGWFKVPGIREVGDRSLDEQMIGLEFGLQECAGKTVLDLGCAEALISREFAKAGATRVLGIEKVSQALDVAREVCASYPQIEFLCVNLERYMPANPEPEQFDIVLALGIAHKPKNPERALRWAASCTRDLLLFRPPGYAIDGWFKSKHSEQRCHSPTVLTDCGFEQERVIRGVRNEQVEYWRRRSPR